MKWIDTTLGQVSTSIQTGPFGSQLHQSDYSAEGTPVVMPKDFVGGKISTASIARVSNSHVERLSRHKICPGDILYSRRGDVGRCACASEMEKGWLCGTGCLRVTIDRKKADPKFVFYQLQTAKSIGWVEKHAVGATMLNLNTSILSQTPVLLPPLHVQSRIAEILSAYDDLIENNRKQIKLLEEAAQRLYKEWFIDLRFPGWETTPIYDSIPEGWEMTTLEELIEFNPKYTVPKAVQKHVFPMSSLSTTSMVLDYTESSLSISVSGARFSNADTLLARITPCLENGKTAYVGGLQDGEIAIGSTEFIVMRSKKLNPYMVYLLARSSDFRKTAINSMTGSDGRQRAQVDKLKLFPYLCPSQSVLDAFERLSKPMFEQIYNLNKQISGLIEARDRLLPKLMNGEMEIKHV